MTATEGPLDTAGLLTAATGTWKVDPGATTVQLHTKAMWGLAKVKAAFKVAEGSATIGPDGAVTGTLVIDAASVDSRNKKRDTHLRGGDFFEVDRYPTFVYAVTGAVPAGADRLKLTGTLTVRGVTRPLEVDATISEATTTSATVLAEVDIDRSQWDVSWAKMGARLDNHVVVNARFNKV